MESKHFSASKLHVYTDESPWRKYEVTSLNKAAANVVGLPLLLLLLLKPNRLGQLLGSINNSTNLACVVLSVICL